MKVLNAMVTKLNQIRSNYIFYINDNLSFLNFGGSAPNEKYYKHTY